MTRAEFAEEYEHLLPFLHLVDEEAEERVTYFEVLTALAYLWFADKPVSLGVFEVGMGGLWDATNLVAGDVAVLTPIALDHPELGSTVTEVAREKAGIIKDGKVAIVREQDADAMSVIEERCTKTGSDLEARVPRLGGRGAAPGRRGSIDRSCGACSARTTISTSRCSVSTPRATRPPRWPRSKPSSTGPSISSRRVRRWPACTGPGAWRSSRTRRRSCSTARTIRPRPRRSPRRSASSSSGIACTS